MTVFAIDVEAELAPTYRSEGFSVDSYRGTPLGVCVAAARRRLETVPGDLPWVRPEGSDVISLASA